MARFERFASAGFKDFEDVVELYRSTTGAVYCAKFKYDSCLYVLKERKVSELGKKKDVMNEVRLLSQLDHPNVIKCEGWFSDDDRQSLFIILEYCPGGDLSKKIEARRKSRRYFSEQYIWFVFYQICLGVQHLHINGIIHRDLKTLNVMLAKKDTSVKIADLGVSRQVSRNTSMLDTFIGTPLYLSPELVDNKPYNEKTDIWSLGVILYELCALTVPFKAANVLTLANMIRKAKYEPVPAIYSNHMERCIPWLLNTNYLNRPSINQVISYCEQRVTADYHGDDMAAEYDSLLHSVARMVHPNPNSKQIPTLPDEDRRREERFEAEHNAEVVGEIKAGVRRERLNRMTRDLQGQSNGDADADDDAGADVGDVSDDSLELPRAAPAKKESALLAAAREKGKDKDKDHRRRRPHTAGSSRKQPASSGTKKAVEEETLIQFELPRIQMLLRRELAQLRRLMKLKDFFGGVGGADQEPQRAAPAQPSGAAGPHANYSQIGPLLPLTGAEPVDEGSAGKESRNEAGGEGESGKGSSLEKKLAEVNARIRVLERGVQANGVLSRADVGKVDALRVLITVQEITVLSADADEANGKGPDANGHSGGKAMLHSAYKEALRRRPSTAVERKHKGPIGYKKLAGRHRNEQQNRGDDHIDGLVGDPDDAERLDQLRIHEGEGIRERERGRNAALARKIEVMRYENPFEAVEGGNKDAFKQKNLDYNLFVHGEEEGLGAVGAAAGGGAAAARARRPGTQPSGPPPSVAAAARPAVPVSVKNNSELGDTDSGGETEDDDCVPGHSKSHAVRVPALATSNSKQEAAAAVAAVLKGLNGADRGGGGSSAVQQIEVSTKGDGTVVLTVRAPAQPGLLSASPVPVLAPAPVPAPPREPPPGKGKEKEFRGGWKGGLYLGNGTEAEVVQASSTGASTGSAPSHNKSVTIDDKVCEIPRSSDADTDAVAGAKAGTLPPFDVRPPSPKPAVIPKCTLFNTQRDKITGKIGNLVEEAGAGVGARVGEAQKVYQKPKFARKKIGSAFKDSEIEINWHPGKPLSEPAPAPNVVAGDGSGSSRGGGVRLSSSPITTPDRTEARKNRRPKSGFGTRESRAVERENASAGKRFNIISGGWE